MGKSAIAFILPFLLISCINHQSEDDNLEISRLWPKSQIYQHSTSEQYWDVQYANGFDISAKEDGILIETFSIEGNEEWNDHVWLPHNKTESSDDRKVVKYPLYRIACQSSTYLAYLEKFNGLAKVTGLCGMKYIQNQEISDQLKINDCKEICFGEKISLESLLAANPELFLIYPFENRDIDKYEESGIQTLMMAEYLEQHPLARLEWIKIFGALTSQYDHARSIFEDAVTCYNSLVTSSISDDNQFVLNLPFGDSWYAPSRSSLVVNLCHDAGLDYYFEDDGGTENVPHSKEEMWELGTSVPYWIIIANRPAGFSLADLLEEEEVYKEFRSVKEEKVIICNTTTSDYFTYGVIEPHIMLEELRNAVEGNYDPEAKYFKILK